MSEIQKYKTTIVSTKGSWMHEYIPIFVKELQKRNHVINIVFDVNDIQSGDFVFYLSCYQIAKKDVLMQNKHNIVVHPSGLPKGRGMSPLTWQILEGKNDIPITLFEADEKVDNGFIYLQDVMHFNGDELIAELRKKQGETVIAMCLKFLDNYPQILATQKKQDAREATYYAKRGPKDSRLDPTRTIVEQFNLLRVVDNENYPAFFELHGKLYQLKINKVG